MLEWDGYDNDPFWVGFPLSYAEGDHRLTILSLSASLISFSIFTFLISTAIKDICRKNRSMTLSGTVCLAFLTIAVSLALPFLVGGLFGVLLVNCPCYIQLATACRRGISKPIAAAETADAAAEIALQTLHDAVSPKGEDSEMQGEEEIVEIILWSSVPSEEELVSSL
ncbi:hypothetical protein AK812_SmicGene24063 [Symbiodinium microadriaticum]|uniref:Uncharacterized protein n=1 Tax=Symbiodinium microadriaticum TaxID=2951 RepID=A0A1Q9DFJ9_SYMMI|nr:hypothetical protein AK812_SmicGene24063 [Symbiodinium microadriaticum]